MAQVVTIHQVGGPEVLTLEDVTLPSPGPQDICLRHTVIGLNFIDCYHRSGLYPIELPSSLGMEAAGVVESVGAEVKHLKAGDRVGYCWGPIGAYATHRIMNANQVVKLPDFMSEEDAAALLLKGCTAEYLIRRTYQVKAGDKVLLQAAAGGVGLIAAPWLKSLGAFVIGTAGSEEKAQLALNAGCDHVIQYDHEDIATKVKDFTDGEGVDVVYDGVGRSTWEASLNSLKPRGMMVSFGNASGPVTNVDLGILSQKGSLYVTRPTLFHYYSTAQDRTKGTNALFDFMKQTDFHPHIGQRYALADIARAHKDLEARRTTGSTILKP
ncbi:MAG: quinone oxidoreductase [Sphingomonadales bacterium]|jgi:NADPH2:quinone reductase